MKKVYLLLLSILVLLIFSCSEDDAMRTEPSGIENTFINVEEATTIARQFMDAQELLGPQTKSSNVDLEMVYTDLQDEVATKSGNDKPAYYIFNIGETGYLIVSAYKATLPVLGYSTESKFDANTIPTNMAAVLVDFKNEINYAREKGLQVDATIEQTRKAYLDGSYLETRANAYSVSPLLGSIKWNQRPYYNAYCPSGTPVGCVATASAQIMRYWKYPSASTGYHSYRHASYGTLSFNYNYSLNWNAMPAGRLTSSNNEVAKFCYGVAVGVDMNFGRQGSGAYQYDVPGMLQKYYKYPSTVKNVYRSYYSDTSWANLIKKELSAGRPVQYAGHGSGGGHSFVCDGYNSNGYFHFNWGWGGMSDGYFLLNALNPGSLGTGGGSGGFNYGQQAVINFAPPGGGDNDPVDPNPNPTPLDYCDSKSYNTYYTYIRQVQLGSMSNVTSGSSTGYDDYTSKKVYASAGASVYCKLVPGFSRYAYTMYWCGWIDLNNDGEFSDSNELFAKSSSTSYLSGYFSLPSDLSKGSYRIRVSMKYGAYPTACEKFSYGEVEDYTLVVQ